LLFFIVCGFGDVRKAANMGDSLAQGFMTETTQRSDQFDFASKSAAQGELQDKNRVNSTAAYKSAWMSMLTCLTLKLTLFTILLVQEEALLAALCSDDAFTRVACKARLKQLRSALKTTRNKKKQTRRRKL
jgi:hypothetical protein